MCGESLTEATSLQILVVVAHNQFTYLITEVDKGSMSTESGHGSVEPYSVIYFVDSSFAVVFERKCSKYSSTITWTMCGNGLAFSIRALVV